MKILKNFLTEKSFDDCLSMKTDNKNALEYSLKASNLIKDISIFFTEPLGLTTFGYKRIYDSGHYLFLSTNQDWVTYHYCTIKDHGTFFQKAMEQTYLNQSYISLWPSYPQDHFLEALNHFGMWHGINFYKRHENYIELFTFSTSQERSSIISLYLNTIPSFEIFKKYFRSKACELIDTFKICDLALVQNILPHTQDLFYKLDNLQDIKKKIEPRLLFIERGNSIIPLTARESDCLSLLQHGTSLKEIGSALNISPRTVETYINNVKQKTGCNNKSTLLKLLQKGFYDEKL